MAHWQVLAKAGLLVPRSCVQRLSRDTEGTLRLAERHSSRVNHLDRHQRVRLVALACFTHGCGGTVLAAQRRVLSSDHKLPPVTAVRTPGRPTVYPSTRSGVYRENFPHSFPYQLSRTSRRTV